MFGVDILPQAVSLFFRPYGVTYPLPVLPVVYRHANEGETEH